MPRSTSIDSILFWVAASVCCMLVGFGIDF
jgi:hypothetical protein